MRVIRRANKLEGELGRRRACRGMRGRCGMRRVERGEPGRHRSYRGRRVERGRCREMRRSCRAYRGTLSSRWRGMRGAPLVAPRVQRDAPAGGA